MVASERGIGLVLFSACISVQHGRANTGLPGRLVQRLFALDQVPICLVGPTLTTYICYRITWGSPNLDLKPILFFPLTKVMLNMFLRSRVLNGLPMLISSAHGMILFGCHICAYYTGNTQTAGSASLQDTQTCVVRACTTTAGT